MTGGRPALRLGVRLAVRDLRRRPWRTLLVVVMVLLPTSAMAAVVTLMRTSERSPEQEAARSYGTADALAHRPSPERFEPPMGTTVAGTPLTPPGPEPAVTEDQLDGLRAQLPEGSAVVVERLVSDRLARGDRRSYVQFSDLPLDLPIVEGRFGRLRGRLAERAGEVVLGQQVAEDLAVDIGQRVTASTMASTLTVTGIIATLGFDGGRGYLTVLASTDASSRFRSSESVLVDLPGDRSVLDVAELGARIQGWSLSSTVSGGVRKTTAVFWTYVGGGVGLIVVSTIIAAAFAIGARRQLRTIGLLSSTGASPATVTWFLVVQGAVTGFIGSVIGVALGVGATRLVPDRIVASMTNQVVDSPVFRPADLVPVVMLGTLVAAGAAWLPARTAAKVPTLQALAGRRPLPRVPARLPLLATLSIALGCALFAMAVGGYRDHGSSLWALVAVAGSLALLAGVVGHAPWMISGLERGSARWPQSWRLAGRSLARSRVRSSAVVAAIATVCAALVAGTTLENSVNPEAGTSLPYLRRNQLVVDSSLTRLVEPSAQAPEGSYRTEPAPLPPQVLERIRSIVPSARVVPVSVLVPGAANPEGAVGGVAPQFVDDAGTPTITAYQGYAAAATPALVDLIGVPARLRVALDRGEAVSVVETPAGARAVTLWPCCGPDAVAPVELALGGWFDSPAASRALPSVLVAEDAARRAGLHVQPATARLVDLGADISDSQRDRLELLAGDIQWESGAGSAGPDSGGFLRSVNLNIPSGDVMVSRAVVKAGVVLAALLLVLAVVAVGLAMAAKDNEDERQVLSAVGAAPRSLRQVGSRRAGLLTLCAAVIAVPTGMLPALVILAARADGNLDDRHVRPDYWIVLFVLVALPLAAGGAAAVVGRVADLVRPPRPDSFAFAD